MGDDPDGYVAVLPPAEVAKLRGGYQPIATSMYCGLAWEM